jgi:hypothetical protein
MSGPPPRGWYVEIDVGGKTLTPEVADEPAWLPSINGLPEADVPVPRDDVLWLSGAADRATARAWLDGTRLPIGQAILVRGERGGAAQRTLLELTGGKQLRRRVTKEVDSEDAHVVVENLVTNNTSYIANVDTPNRADITDRVVQSATDKAGLDEIFSADIDATTPARIVDGGNASDFIEPLQTAFLFTTTDDLGGFPTVTDSGAEDDEALNLTTSSQSPFTSFSANYEIPADVTTSELKVAVRAKKGDDAPSSSSVFFEVDLDGTRLAGFDVDAFSTSSFEWQEMTTSEPSSNVQGGTVTGSLDGDLTQSGEGFILDAICVYDQRFPVNFDNNPSPHFSEPYKWGDGIIVEGAVEQTQLAATELTATVSTITSDVQNLGLGVSGDGGITYTTATDTDTVTETFNTTDKANIRVELSGQGTQSDSPTDRANRHEIFEVELLADFSGVPRLVNESFDDDLVDVLREIADKTGSIWELQYDESAGSFSVEWSDPGQRSSDTTLSPAAYEVERDSEIVVEAATVVGGRRRVDNEQITASVGSAVALEESRLITGVVEVVDAGDGTVYSVGVDYTVNHRQGTITALSGGSIADGTDLDVSYQYRVSGRHESSSWGGDPSTDIKRDIPSIPSAAACEQAATRLVRQTDDATLSARVDLGGIDPDQSVLAALSVEELTTVTDSWEPRAIERSPESPHIRLGAGLDVEETLKRIRRELGDVERRV